MNVCESEQREARRSNKLYKVFGCPCHDFDTLRVHEEKDDGDGGKLGVTYEMKTCKETENRIHSM